MTTPRRRPPKSSESIARLVINQDGSEAWLEARSYEPNADLVLDGKGTGIVRIAGSPIVTIDTLTNLDELADILANITIEGADPALVTALQGQVAAIFDTFGGKAGATIADLIAYAAGVDDNLATTTIMAFSAQSGLQQFLTTVAGNPDPSLITVANGGLAGLAGKAWEALLAQVAAGGVDEAAVQALIDAALAALPPGVLDEDAVKTLIGAALTTFIMPILDGHTDDIAALQTDLVSVRDIVVGLVNDLSELSLGDVQPLLDLLALKQDATVADVAVIWQALSDDLVKVVDDLQRFFNGVTELPTGDATAFQALSAVLNIKSAAETADKNSSTALDWALAVINAVNGESIAGDPAVANVGPAMDKIRADIAAAQAAVDALAALGVGGGDGTSLTAEQAQLILDTATDLATIIAGVTGSGGTADDFVATLGTLAGQVRTAQTTADAAKADVVKLQTENAALKARLDALEAKAQNLTADGTLSTVHVLGDGFVDSNGNAILPNLQQGLQLFVDALTWGAEGAYGENGQTIETLFDALVAQSRTLKTQTEVSTYLLLRDEWVNENLTALVTYVQDAHNLTVAVSSWVQEQVVELTAFSQGIIDAINGPDATLESIAGMFWLLNDVIMALIEVTGITLPGKA